MRPTPTDHLTEAELAARGLSRETDIVLDRDGRFLVAGVPFEHERLAEVFAGWLDRGPDGRYVLRNDLHWVYLTVEGAPLHARRAELEGDEVTLVLHGGERAPLRPETLREGPDGALHADVRDGTWVARLAPAAALDLAPLLVEHEGGAAIVVGGRAHPIPQVDDPLTRRE
ncbi:MAG: DUF1285 domain-containing protein [Planctomycetes bacterium]|nr:DUF1285 domain-containing protein [Planctomycetota bacterium]